jgi:protein TonB
VLPRYPRLAREMGREGTVVLSLTIDENGILQDVAVVESAGFGFDEEALQAMQASTFKAALRNGQPVASRALLPVRFILKGSGND